MIDLNYLSHEDKELLAEDCEEYIHQLRVPLFSHSYDNIILQAVSLGYEIEKFEGLNHKPVE